VTSIELTDGTPVPEDRSHTEILPSGQQRGYVVLSPDERAKGLVKPLRRSYVHSKCGSITKMALSIAETYARDPRFYTGTFCVGCGAHFPLWQFAWEDGEPMNPNDQDEWQRTEGERRRKARQAALQNRVAQLRSDLAAAERELSESTADQQADVP
jgi:hypothetical protein